MHPPPNMAPMPPFNNNMNTHPPTPLHNQSGVGGSMPPQMPMNYNQGGPMNYDMPPPHEIPNFELPSYGFEMNQ